MTRLNQTTSGAIPLRNNMRPVLQQLANTTLQTKQIADQAETAFQEYINQCAELLHLDPATIMFDAATASFIPKDVPADTPPLPSGTSTLRDYGIPVGPKAVQPLPPPPPLDEGN